MATRIVRWYRLEPPSLPVRHWLPQYKARWLRPDLVAALAVWAVLVPEGMAYASLAGMPPETGLFAALLPLLAYAALGTCRELTVGPSSAIAAYSAAAIAPLALGDSGRFIALSALLALLAGGLLLVAGLARAGFVADFFARPVLTGFVAGLALVIAVGQVSKLLGVEGGGTGFFGKLWELIRQLGEASLGDAARRRRGPRRDLRPQADRSQGAGHADRRGARRRRRERPQPGPARRRRGGRDPRRPALVRLPAVQPRRRAAPAARRVRSGAHRLRRVGGRRPAAGIAGTGTRWTPTRS